MEEQKSKRKGGLGRGLDALFAENELDMASSGGAVMLRVSQIEPQAGQPRAQFEREPLEQLAESIGRHGVLQPIIVRRIEDSPAEMYRIIAGERRWRASKLAGLTEIPAIIRDMDDAEALQLALVENIQREDLNPVEEAYGMAHLIDMYGLTQEQVAHTVGRSRSAVANSIRLLGLPAEALEYLRDGTLSVGHARALLAIQDGKHLMEVASHVIDRGLSVRDTERIVQQLAKARQNAGNEAPAKSASSTNGADARYFEALESRMTDKLGQRVKIRQGAKIGVLQIEYTDGGQLERMVKQLCGENIFD